MSQDYKAKKQAQMKRVYKDQMTATHDLFKMLPATMKKNVSFKKFQPQIEEFEHCHIFHTVDSRGKAQLSSSAVGGHFHDVEWSVSSTGEFQIKCSEPFQIVTVVTKAGMTKKEKRPVAFEDGINDKTIKDTHTHEFQYLGSETLEIGRPRAVAPSGEFKPRALPKDVDFKDA